MFLDITHIQRKGRVPNTERQGRNTVAGYQIQSGRVPNTEWRAQWHQLLEASCLVNTISRGHYGPLLSCQIAQSISLLRSSTLKSPFSQFWRQNRSLLPQTDVKAQLHALPSDESPVWELTLCELFCQRFSFLFSSYSCARNLLLSLDILQVGSSGAFQTLVGWMTICGCMLTCTSSSFIITTRDYSGLGSEGGYVLAGGTQLRQLEPPLDGSVPMNLSTLRLRLEIQESREVNLNYYCSDDLNLGRGCFSSYLLSPQSYSQFQSYPYSYSQSSQSSSQSSPDPSSSQSQSASSSSQSSSSSFCSLASSSSSLINRFQLTMTPIQVSNMNIYCIREDSQALEQIGVAMDTPERLKLQLGLVRLSELANADQLLFWGKITTSSTPYYIAVAVDFKGHYGFPHKKFYYSKDTFQFQELPPLDEFNRHSASQFNSLPFTGNPQTLLLATQPEAEDKKPQQPEHLDSDEEDAVKIQPKNYLEEDRLAYTVGAIEHQCQLVPLGAFRIITAHQIRYNQQFTGISAKAFALNKFAHFRYPLSASAKQKIESVQAVFSFDFLDKVENPSFWSAQLNTTQTLGTVRSFLWPGYVSYCFLNKSRFGAVYYGNGLKQAELPFYL